MRCLQALQSLFDQLAIAIEAADAVHASASSQASPHLVSRVEKERLHRQLKALLCIRLRRARSISHRSKEKG